MNSTSQNHRKTIGERVARVSAGAFIVLAMMLLLIPIGNGRQVSIASQLNTHTAP